MNTATCSSTPWPLAVLSCIEESCLLQLAQAQARRAHPTTCRGRVDHPQRRHHGPASVEGPCPKFVLMAFGDVLWWGRRLLSEVRSGEEGHVVGDGADSTATTCLTTRARTRLSTTGTFAGRTRIRPASTWRRWRRPRGSRRWRKIQTSPARADANPSWRRESRGAVEWLLQGQASTGGGAVAAQQPEQRGLHRQPADGQWYAHLCWATSPGSM